jgi:hypothetical protein
MSASSVGACAAQMPGTDAIFVFGGRGNPPFHKAGGAVLRFNVSASTADLIQTRGAQCNATGTGWPCVPSPVRQGHACGFAGPSTFVVAGGTPFVYALDVSTFEWTMGHSVLDISFPAFAPISRGGLVLTYGGYAGFSTGMIQNLYDGAHFVDKTGSVRIVRQSGKDNRKDIMPPALAGAVMVAVGSGLMDFDRVLLFGGAACSAKEGPYSNSALYEGLVESYKVPDPDQEIVIWTLEHRGQSSPTDRTVPASRSGGFAAWAPATELLWVGLGGGPFSVIWGDLWAYDFKSHHWTPVQDPAWCAAPVDWRTSVAFANSETCGALLVGGATAGGLYYDIVALNTSLGTARSDGGHPSPLGTTGCSLPPGYDSSATVRR